EPEPVPELLKDLIDDYLSGFLEEARLHELEQRLCADADARRYFVCYARLHTDLHLQVRAWKATERALDKIERLAQTGSPYTPTPLRTDSSPPQGSFLRQCLAPRLLVPAACLLFAIGVSWWLVSRNLGQEGSGRESTIAWLVNAQNCQWSEGEPVAGMQAGKIFKLERGLAEICFLCGARVVLEGPARLELLSEKSARLLHGKLTARVPGPATGFAILSPQGKVIDLGTEFGIVVSDNGTTEVYVFQGKVEAH